MALALYQRTMHAVRFFLLRRLPTCKQTVATISESLERPLTLRERITLKLHLWICVWCAWYLEHLHILREAVALRSAKVVEGEPKSGPTLSTEARERINRALSRTDK